MPAQIITTFSDFALVRQPSEPPYNDDAPLFPSFMALERMRDRVFDNRPFFREFDYTWVKNPANFSGLVDRFLQLILVDTIAEVPYDHPEYDELGDICIRRLEYYGFGAEAFAFGRFKYITLSSGLLHQLKFYVASFLRLRECIPNLGHDSVRPLMSETEVKQVLASHSDAELVLDSLLTVSAATAAQKLPDNARQGYRFFFDVHQGLVTRSQELYGDLYRQTLAFAVFHELSHLLKHRIEGGARNLHEEFQADTGASSFNIIAGSRWPRIFLNQWDGPAQFFTMLMILSCIIASSGRGSTPPSSRLSRVLKRLNAKRRIEIETAEEESLAVCQRASGYFHTFDHNGIAEFSRDYAEALETNAVIYDALRQKCAMGNIPDVYTIELRRLDSMRSFLTDSGVRQSDH